MENPTGKPVSKKYGFFIIPLLSKLIRWVAGGTRKAAEDGRFCNT